MPHPEDPELDQPQRPDYLGAHITIDNVSTHRTPEIRRWLQRHPRFHANLTPVYSFWINLVERCFSEPITEWIRRGTHRSVTEFKDLIQHWVGIWNNNPRPYTVDQIPTLSPHIPNAFPTPGTSCLNGRQPHRSIHRHRRTIVPQDQWIDVDGRDSLVFEAKGAERDQDLR